MAFAGLNYWAVLAATVASFAFGALWYGTLAKHWLDALGKTEEEMRAGGPPVFPMILSFVLQLIMAWVLAGLIGHLGSGQVNAFNGVVSGAFVWFGFVLTTQVINHSYQDQPTKLTVIDCGHWLGVLLIQGLVLGLIGL